MSPSTWGPPTWIFMHTLAAKVKEEHFSTIGPQMIAIFIQICSVLPCPECSQHAKEFWSKVKVSNVKTKEDLVNLLFVFHNMVNKRKHLLPFRHVDLQFYHTRNVIITYNSFANHFNTRGNMNLLNDSFHRNLLLVSLRKWVMTHIAFFD